MALPAAICPQLTPLVVRGPCNQDRLGRMALMGRTGRTG